MGALKIFSVWGACVDPLYQTSGALGRLVCHHPWEDVHYPGRDPPGMFIAGPQCMPRRRRPIRVGRVHVRTLTHTLARISPASSPTCAAFHIVCSVAGPPALTPPSLCSRFFLSSLDRASAFSAAKGVCPCRTLTVRQAPCSVPGTLPAILSQVRPLSRASSRPAPCVPTKESGPLGFSQHLGALLGAHQ